MTRTPRADKPGAWHHVMNRGVARRTVFEDRGDVRAFLALLAREVRAERVELHAYCVMTTHYHLLVRSLLGDLAGTMMRVQRDYVRRFNRQRRRDGPLLRGRYRSRRADSELYRRLLVRYIDFNPVEARIVARPALYPFGSAWHYLRRSGPPWLARSWVESVVAEIADSRSCDAHTYEAVFGATRAVRAGAWLERVMMGAGGNANTLDDLVRATPESVRDWMQRKARLADGTAAGAPTCLADSVVDLLGDSVPTGFCDLTQWNAARAGLWRMLCGWTNAAVARRLAVSSSTASNAFARHLLSMRDDPVYAESVSRLAAAALRVGHPARVLGLVRDIC